MPLQVPPGYGQAAYTFQLTGDAEPIIVTCGHDLNAVDDGDYGAAAERLFNSFGTHVMGAIPNVYSLQFVTLYVGQDLGGTVPYESTGVPVVGGEGGASLPQNCAVLVRKRTGAAGRRGRGRMYMPGARETAVTPLGIIDGTYVDDWQASVDGWYDDLVDTSVGALPLPPVILHRSEGHGVEPGPTPITAFTVENVIATQRQRMRP